MIAEKDAKWKWMFELSGWDFGENATPQADNLLSSLKKTQQGKLLLVIWKQLGGLKFL